MQEYSVKINRKGTESWYNEDGLLHREDDKPAIIYHNGDKCWCRNGKLHRDGDKPAEVLNTIKVKTWYRDGQRHRDDRKPAVIRHTEEDGIIEEYWINGVRQPDPETKLVDSDED
jgi:protein associated with RNAse G/E